MYINFINEWPNLAWTNQGWDLYNFFGFEYQADLKKEKKISVILKLQNKSLGFGIGEYRYLEAYLFWNDKKKNAIQTSYKYKQHYAVVHFIIFFYEKLNINQ